MIFFPQARCTWQNKCSPVNRMHMGAAVGVVHVVTICSAMNVFIDVNNISQRVHVNIQRWTFPMQYCNELASSWWQALTIVNSSMNFLPSEVTSQYKAVFEIIQRWFLFRIPSEVTTIWHICETYSFSGEHFCPSEVTTTKWQIMYPKTNFLKSVFKNYFHFTHPINYFFIGPFKTLHFRHTIHRWMSISYACLAHAQQFSKWLKFSFDIF